MQQNHFTTLRTQRLVLRKLKPADWEMISYLRSDPEVNLFVKRPSAPTKEKALGFISKIHSGIDSAALYYWAITEKDKDVMIGSICLWNFSEDRKTAEIGYDLSPTYQGQGMMSESLKGILEFGFKTLHLTTIEAYTQIQNESSKKLLEKNGFTVIQGKKDPDNADNIVFEIKNQ